MSNRSATRQHCPEPAAEIDLQRLAGELEASYADRVGVNLAETFNLPGRAEVERLIDRLMEVVFPGFSSSPRHRESLTAETTVLLLELKKELLSQISRAMRFGCRGECCGECEWAERGAAAVKTLFDALPEIRALMKARKAALSEAEDDDEMLELDLSDEEKKKIQGLPKSLGEALDALEADHDYLTAGGVFPERLLEIWIKKRRAENEMLSSIPHPAEFAQYYDL